MKRQGPSNKTRPIYRDIPRVSRLFFVPETRTLFDSSFLKIPLTFFISCPFLIISCLISMISFKCWSVLWSSLKCFCPGETYNGQLGIRVKDSHAHTALIDIYDLYFLGLDSIWRRVKPSKSGLLVAQN